MYPSFYTGYLGAKANLQNLDVIGNNLANINNSAFKPKTSVFQSLLQYNLNDSEGAVTELQTGNGVRVQGAYTSFETMEPVGTTSPLDFAIVRDNVFFRVMDRGTGEISYTRNGHFHRGQVGDTFYLMTDNDKYVIGKDGRPVVLQGAESDGDGLSQRLALFTFSNPSRLMSAGNNEYVTQENMTAVAVDEEATMQGYLEVSGTNLVKEMARLIESQRAYSYALQMVQTSDEIVGTINTLKG